MLGNIVPRHWYAADVHSYRTPVVMTEVGVNTRLVWFRLLTRNHSIVDSSFRGVKTAVIFSSGVDLFQQRWTQVTIIGGAVLLLPRAL